MGAAPLAALRAAGTTRPASWARVRTLLAAALAALAASGAAACGAPPPPAKPLSVLVTAPAGGYSHYLLMQRLSRSLAARGHRVTFLLAARDADVLDADLDARRVEYATRWGMEEYTAFMRELHSYTGNRERSLAVLKAGHAACEDFMTDARAVAALRGTSFDVALLDGAWYCSFAIADMLALENRVVVHPLGFSDPFNTVPFGVLSPSAYVFMGPTPLSPAIRDPRRWGPVQRAQNMASGLLLGMLRRETDDIYDELRAAHNITPATLSQSLRLTPVVLLYPSTFALEAPRPLPPFAHLVGPLMVDVKPLPPGDDLTTFIESDACAAGLLYISLGTKGYVSDEALKEIAAAAAAASPVCVVWKHVGALPESAPPLPPTVHLVKWAPQASILAHPRTVAFLSHCGANSANEAAYFGVPVIAMPLFGDQPQNAAKLERAGIAVVLFWPRTGKRLQPASAAQIGAALATARSEPVVAAARRVRALTRLAGGVNASVSWVEHVAEHGVAHLLPEVDVAHGPLARMGVDAVAVLLAPPLLLVLYRLVRRSRGPPGVSKPKTS